MAATARLATQAAISRLDMLRLAPMTRIVPISDESGVNTERGASERMVRSPLPACYLAILIVAEAVPLP